MDSVKPVLLFCLVATTVYLGAAYPGTGGTMAGGGGDVEGNPYCLMSINDPRCTNPDDPSSWPGGELPSCMNDKNDNGLWGEDYAQEMWDEKGSFTADVDSDPEIEGDPGCSSPFDRTEAALWDTDLTATFNNLNPGETPSLSEDPTVYFSGRVQVGPDLGSWGPVHGDSLSKSFVDKIQSTTVERSLKSSSPSLGEGKYGETGLGKNPEANSKAQYSNLPTGTARTSNGRIVDSPVPKTKVPGFSGIVNTAITCGDGYSTSTEKILTDSGNVQNVQNENVDTVSEIDPTVETGLSQAGPGSENKCRADHGVLGQRELRNPVYDPSSIDIDQGTCSNPDGDDMSPEPQYEASGDKIIRHYTEDSTIQDCDTDNDGDPDKTLNVYTKKTKLEFDCDRMNFVKGGTDQVNDDVGLSKPDNDPAATFTDWSAYGEPSNSQVWCQYEKIITVDADGPTGNGDGFVVINSGTGVIGTISLDGTDSVGKEVYARTSTPGNTGSLSDTGTNYLTDTLNEGQWDLECPEVGSNGNNANYCIKYLDFMTKGQGNKWNNVDDAVKVKVHQVAGNNGITPDQSYSACKFINMVSRKSGNGEALDCDYEASISGASGDMSPLSEPCGDQNSEKLVMAEGNQVNFPFLTKQIYQSQTCIDFGKDRDAGYHVPGNQNKHRTLTSDACTLGGVGYSVGTVRNVTDYGKNAETGTYSPDLEVCLNPDEDKADKVKWDNPGNSGTNSQNQDFGGEWYDLDNEKVQNYIQSNFNADAYKNDGITGQPKNRIETYMRDNPNPHHSQYNPTGGKTGLVMEDDCGNPKNRFKTNLKCEDDTLSSIGQNLFHTFFNDLVTVTP